MRRFAVISLSLLLLALAACQSPAEPEIIRQEVTRIVEAEVTRLMEVEITRIVEVEVTQLVEVESTRIVEVEVTPRPTNTPPPTTQEQRDEFLRLLTNLLEAMPDVERVNVVRYGEGTIEAELFTQWASRDRQADVSWTIVTTMAEALRNYTPKLSSQLTGSENFTFVLTTYSTDGDYRYESRTDLETFKQLDARQLSFSDWAAIAQAGFK